MKWGVRRARKLAESGHTEKSKAVLQKSYEKASKKLAKMDRKIEKYQAKSTKFRQKADKNAYGWFGSQRKAQKYGFKASRQQFKANKKAAKAEKWIKNMEKNYSKTSVKGISSEQANLGKKYHKMLLTRAQTSM